MTTFLIASHSRMTRELLRQAIDLVDGTALAGESDQAKTLAALLKQKPPFDVLVLDADLPDRSEEGAAPLQGIKFLQTLRDRGIQTRCLLVINNALELANYLERTFSPCAVFSLPEHASSLQEDLELCLSKLLLLPSLGAKRRTATGDRKQSAGSASKKRVSIIDVTVEARGVSCQGELIEADGSERTLDASIPIIDAQWLSQMEAEIMNWSPIQRDPASDTVSINRDWLRVVTGFGRQAYDKVFSGSTKTLLDKAIGFCGDSVEGLRIRFNLDQIHYRLPFELMYLQDRQVYLCAALPVARTLKVPASVPPKVACKRNKTPKVLVIASDVGRSHKVKGPKDADAELRGQYATLKNLSDELLYFRNAKQNGLDVEIIEGDEVLAATKRLLKIKKKWDIVHFAGHSRPLSDGRVFFLFRKSLAIAEAVSVDQLADWVAGSGARLAYLSSCNNSTIVTARKMAELGVPNVIGFRWDLDDQCAAEFTEQFYNAHLRENLGTAESFSTACAALSRTRSDHPIWASPIHLAHGDAWWKA